MLTQHGIRLKDYYRLDGNFNNDKEVEEACNKRIEEKQAQRSLETILDLGIDNKSLYLFAYKNKNEIKR